MTANVTITGAEIQIMVEEVLGGGNHSHRCSINTSRGIQWSSSQTQTPIVDCDAQGNPAWMETDVDGLSCTITGGGRISVGDEDFWDDWFISGGDRGVKFRMNKTGASVWTANFKLTDWGIQAGDRKERGEFSVTLMSSGVVTRASV